MFAPQAEHSEQLREAHGRQESALARLRREMAERDDDHGGQAEALKKVSCEEEARHVAALGLLDDAHAARTEAVAEVHASEHQQALRGREREHERRGAEHKDNLAELDEAHGELVQDCEAELRAEAEAEADAEAAHAAETARLAGRREEVLAEMARAEEVRAAGGAAQHGSF